MRKKAGIILCITGIVLVIIAVIMLFIIPGYQDEQVSDNEDITEEMQEIEDGEENSTTTEYQKTEQEANQEQLASKTDSKLQASTKQSAHDINPEVYEWPCGNERYQDWDEPRQVTEFAKYKEYYEQIAQEFLEYEGKDIYFYANEDGVYFDECKNEGSVKVTYDKSLLLNLFEKSKMKSIKVRSDYIIFNTNISDREKIIYFYDETLTYDDPLPSDKDDLMSHYSMVNIAPHWWWENLETSAH